MDKRKSRAILKEIRERLENGEKITKEGILQEYFKSNSTINYMIARDRVRGWFNLLQYQYASKGKTFKSLNSDHEWGLAQTEGEFRYVATNAYTKVKGITRNVNQSLREAKSLGLISPVETRVGFLTAPAAEIAPSSKKK